MKIKLTVITAVVLILYSCTNSNIEPLKLTAEYMDNPTAVDDLNPILSWINNPKNIKIRGAEQSAYQICVASSLKNLSKGEYDIWDSGKIFSSKNNLISYSGKQLESAKDYWWKVQVWDNNDNPSGWSEPAKWTTGLLSKQEWTGVWIGAPWQGEKRAVIQPVLNLEGTPPNAGQGQGQAQRQRQPAPTPAVEPNPLLRTTFDINKKIASAKAFVTGLGYFEFYVNGVKAGDEVLAPNFTNTGVREDLAPTSLVGNSFRDYKVMYLGYDITDKLVQGKNAVGAILGNGIYNATSRWITPYGTPRFICEIIITYTDGSVQKIASNENWLAHRGPITDDDTYTGETYDARLEVPNWATIECDESDWEKVAIRNAPSGNMKAQTFPNDKVMEVLKPVSIKKNEAGNYMVDFGEEISGWINFLKISGESGDTISVRFISESAVGTETYICKGGGIESYAPRFTWFVFREAEISGYPGELTADMLTAEAVYTAVEEGSTFETSNELFNNINKIYRRTQTDNLHGGFSSDCPHRERVAYTGDGQVATVAVLYNYNAQAFYTKWIQDIADAQDPITGYVPNAAPPQPRAGGGVPWGAAMNIMPWEFYVHYGDIDMLKRNYFAMTEQVRYMLTWLTEEGTMLGQRSTTPGGEPTYWLNLGEWCQPFEMPTDELVHTFYMWRCIDFTAKAAKALGYNEDAAKYTSMAKDVKNAFHNKFYDPDTKSYGKGGCDIFALAMGDVPVERLADVINTVKVQIDSVGGNLYTGIFGTQYFFETLADYGMNDLAYEAMNQTDFPSYGNWIAQGSTTMWEHWNGRSSHNHPMFGGGLTWFYRKLAGLSSDENEPGFKHIIIKPMPVKDVENVNYSIDTPYGTAAVSYSQDNGSFKMNVTIPVGSYATIYIPSNGKNIEESGVEISSAMGIKVIGPEGGYSKVEVAQGNYSFVVI